ncbi:antibiotic biosynthesis monooxygenase family protein [Spirillospora sp. NPDC047279]|uniref:antibiotic biosynthesis monooxygenase family protein n=1 Tax=Spirillospora sp. NPDC047279 TaxID=3155478 RepID=UPI00340F53B8
MPALQPDARTEGGLVFVNRFTVKVPPEQFERVFARTSEFMGRQPGFIRFTLLRNAEDPGSYVNVAQWRDRESFQKAVSHPDFQPHAAALRELSTSEHGLYTPRLTFAAEAVATDGR